MVRDFTFGMAALAAAGFAGSVQGATVVELIDPSIGDEILLSDENREELINNVGAANIIDEGDVLAGVFGVEQLFVNGDRKGQLLMQNGNSELSGLFEIRVVSKTATGRMVGGQMEYEFVFGPNTGSEFEGGTGAMVKAYEDEVGGTTYFGELDDSKEGARDVVSDGELFISAGIADEDDFFVGTGFEDITLAGPPSFRIGESIFALSRLGGSFDFPLAEIALGEGAGEFVGTSNIGPGLRGSAWELSSNTNFNMTIIPSPAAAGAGLVMLGGLLLKRRQA